MFHIPLPPGKMENTHIDLDTGFASMQILLCGNCPGSRNELAGIPALLRPAIVAGSFILNVRFPGERPTLLSKLTDRRTCFVRALSPNLLLFPA